MLCQSLQGFATQVVRHNRPSRSARQMATHRLPHHTEANKADRGDRCWFRARQAGPPVPFLEGAQSPPSALRMSKSRQLPRRYGPIAAPSASSGAFPILNATYCWRGRASTLKQRSRTTFASRYNWTSAVSTLHNHDDQQGACDMADNSCLNSLQAPWVSHRPRSQRRQTCPTRRSGTVCGRLC